MTFKTQSLIIILDSLNNPECAEVLISNSLLKYDMSVGNINVFCIFPLREESVLDIVFILTAILKEHMNQIDNFRYFLLHPFLLSVLLVLPLSSNFLLCHFVYPLAIAIQRGK